MISIFELERAAAGGWRAPEEVPLGDWLLRAAAGFTGRANSALAIGAPGLPLAEAIGRVCDWYRVRGWPAMVAVPYPTGQPERSAVDRYLAGQHWRITHGAIVMTAGPEAVDGQADLVSIADQPDDGWLSRYQYRGDRPPPISAQLLRSAPWQAFASVRYGGRTVAVGRVAVADRWAGLTAVAVDPDFRRRGLGQAITAGLVNAAVEYGVTGIYLQVEDGNLAARSLYQGLGFTEHHGYHYRVAR
jgi:N-acetylglutamate synthase